MAEKLTNITAPQYRCSLGGCHAVYTDRTPERYRCDVTASCPAVLDDDSGNFIFIGELLDPVPEELAGKIGATEAAVKLSAELVLSSLGIADLIEAAARAEKELLWAASQFDHQKRPDHAQDCRITADALREALSSIKGGK